MRSIPLHLVVDSASGISEDQCEQIAASFADYGVHMYMHTRKRVTAGTFVISGHAHIDKDASLSTLINSVHEEFTFLDLIYGNSLMSNRTSVYIDILVEKWRSERKFFQQCMPPSPIDVIDEMFPDALSRFDGHFHDRLQKGELKTYGHVAISLSNILGTSIDLIENLQSSIEHHLETA